MKKPFEETTVGRIAIAIGKIFLGSFLKRQKFNKTEKGEKRIDDILNQLQFGTLIDLPAKCGFIFDVKKPLPKEW